ncbi:RNA polymerase sigma factor [Mucilaginibacter pocheonensis]|uniref:RNA polymerase sigma-70 factor (ECF subfamily) n=1 Tax=Mucilaginibacter pocheonensis TaxID=398050 RepID=A0ABU1TAU3_9SPHI|nr:sigma-70 family RNA polymerase sigma factor [Mucilaginibacter pocheonensis]MDR6942520.1 RNA polymerase sigma-70 factor (ECF subfamily) [Mucilaginibacter pocheonensis]
MNNNELLPHLFRTEYRKIASVLYKHFGFEHPEIAEDIASDTFLTAAETWGIKGLPENPVAWLYTVARNKAKDHLRRGKVFDQKISPDLQSAYNEWEEIEINLSDEHIRDSQLQLMFAICQPVLPPESQIGLALRILCGFGIEEIADAFLSNKETINKRLFRAKEKLREQQVKIEFPPAAQISARAQAVLTTLYLLFNEGYYSSSKDSTLRKDLCLEAMRLTHLLIENESTNLPDTNALMALMCFHASRFEARTDVNGEMIRYDEQDTSLWNDELIGKGKYYLNLSSEGDQLSKYHVEAAIAWWHTIKADSVEKWESILQLYNRLLQIAYSPVVALNRTYALYKARGKQEAIGEAEKLQLNNNHLYHVLLGHLYTGIDQQTAAVHLKTALKLAKTTTEKNRIRKDLENLA